MKNSQIKIIQAISITFFSLNLAHASDEFHHSKGLQPFVYHDPTECVAENLVGAVKDLASMSTFPTEIATFKILALREQAGLSSEEKRIVDDYLISTEELQKSNLGKTVVSAISAGGLVPYIENNPISWQSFKLFNALQDLKETPGLSTSTAVYHFLTIRDRELANLDFAASHKADLLFIKSVVTLPQWLEIKSKNEKIFKRFSQHKASDIQHYLFAIENKICQKYDLEQAAAFHILMHNKMMASPNQITPSIQQS